jgi:hypothetical protein
MSGDGHHGDHPGFEDLIQTLLWSYQGHRSGKLNVATYHSQVKDKLDKYRASIPVFSSVTNNTAWTAFEEHVWWCVEQRYDPNQIP